MASKKCTARRARRTTFYGFAYDDDDDDDLRTECRYSLSSDFAVICQHWRNQMLREHDVGGRAVRVAAALGAISAARNTHAKIDSGGRSHFKLGALKSDRRRTKAGELRAYLLCWEKV